MGCQIGQTTRNKQINILVDYYSILRYNILLWCCTHVCRFPSILKRQYRENCCFRVIFTWDSCTGISRRRDDWTTLSPSGIWLFAKIAFHNLYITDTTFFFQKILHGGCMVKNVVAYLYFVTNSSKYTSIIFETDDSEPKVHLYMYKSIF